MRHFSEILQVIPIFCDYQLLIYFPLNSQQQISLPNYLLVRQALRFFADKRDKGY